MECRILGPVRIEVGGEPVTPARRRVRHLLALLLLEVGQPLSTRRLVDLLWPDEPPVNDRAVLQTVVSRLRATLAAIEGIELVRRGDGYLIRTDPDNVDAYRFRQLVERAGRARDASARADLTRRALSLWRGPALADVGIDPAGNPACAGLNELRQQALDLRIRADLELGRHEALVGELTGLVAADPLNERAVAQLVLALYRSGRRADAVATCQRAKARLATELGLDPGAELQRLEVAVLRADPALDVAPAAPSPQAPGEDGSAAGEDGSAAGGDDATVVTRSVPAQMPADVPEFTGRRAYLEALDALVEPRSGEAGATVLISAIDGMAGVGKTALAVHWARRAREHFPDGQLYLDLRGYAETPPLRPIEALTRLLRGLRVPVDEIPVDADAAAGLLRTVVADRRMLLLLDNARTAEQVQPLLPGRGPSVVLVTSREQLGGLVAREGARRLAIDVLAPDESITLLTHIVGSERVRAEPDAAGELARLCAHLPLALRIAAANLVGNPRTTIAGYVRELRDHDPLTGLEVAGDPQASVRSAFGLSYQALPVGAQRLFRLLALVPGQDLHADAAAALAGQTRSSVRAHLSSLVRTHLVAEVDDGRFAQHDLLRLYARELAGQEDTDTGRAAAVHRLLAHYLAGASAAAALAYPQPVCPGTAPVSAPPFATAPQALAWLEAERANLVAAVVSAASAGPAQMAWLLADALHGFFRIRGHTADWLATAQAALAAAAAVGDVEGMAAAHRILGNAYSSLARYPEAVKHLGAAMTYSRQAGWREGESSATGSLAIAYAETGELRRAVGLLGRALTLSRQLGRTSTEARHLGNLAVLRISLGELAVAATETIAALDLYRQRGSRHGEAVMLINLGWISYFRGHPRRARELLDAGLALHRQSGARSGEAVACVGLAEVHAMVGESAQAVAWATTALELAREIGERRTETMALIALADAERAAGDPGRAVDHSLRAVQLARDTDNQCPLCEAHLTLAHTCLDLGAEDRAAENVELSLAIAHRYGYQLFGGRALTLRAEIQLRRGRHAAAIATAGQALASHRRTGHRPGEARTLTVLGDAHQKAGDAEAAAAYHRQADALLDADPSDTVDPAVAVESADALDSVVIR
jgi:DNA-binding SARP family transcriptional activator